MFGLSVCSFDKYRNENGLQLANNEVNTGWEPCWMENGETLFDYRQAFLIFLNPTALPNFLK